MNSTEWQPGVDYHSALAIVLLYGPRGARFLMSEVPLYCARLKEGVARLDYSQVDVPVVQYKSQIKNI